MHKLLDDEEEIVEESAQSIWTGRVLGFLGSAVIFWILLNLALPVVVDGWGMRWLQRFWLRVVIVALASVGFTTVLSRIENTIWARYYVIIGYLLCLVLIVWIVLRLFRIA
jgi:hypothetical protein